MTITYTGEVATCRGFGTFLKLLYRWRGSIYKLVWLDLLCFLLFYYILNLTYRLLLDEHSKRIFEGVVNYCSYHGNVIPLSFVLGFYVTVVMNRWWNQYTSIPWPDSIAVFVSATVHGQDERGRLMRRTIVRYVCLCLTMVLSMISPRVKKRFPTLDNFVEAGLLLDNEKIIMENLNEKFPKPSKHWMPIVWAASIVTRARKEGRVRDDFAVKTILDELNKFRGQAGLLLSYDTISVPLVYTQVCLYGLAYLKKIRLPSYLGSMSSSSMPLHLNINWRLWAVKVTNGARNMAEKWISVIRFLSVVRLNDQKLLLGEYWDEVFPSELPYTLATENAREEHPEPSTARVAVPPRQRSMVTVNPSSVKMDEMVPSHTVSYKFAPPEQLQMNDDAQSGIHFIVSTRGSKRGKKEDRNSMGLGSTNSVASLQQTPMTRTNSVTSMLKRLFSKEEQRQTPVPNQVQTDGVGRFTISASNPTLNKPAPGGGSMKIANEVIEEVDEQATITSMAKRPENRPTAQSLFAQGPPPPSEPVNVPARNTNLKNHSQLSSSAPTQWAESASPAATLSTQPSFVSEPEQRPRLDSDVGPSLSAAGSQTLLDETDGDCADADADGDAFDRLRSARSAARRAKYLQKMLARSVSAQQPVGSIEILDNEILLVELMDAQAALQRQETDSKEETT
ncbi:bestrophin-1 [Leguminivora glycinivorella]|uniref:bestrophin-1 n=1 Tax=Leguminivora glycinivorella TaxID=1035111 RepID=UPI00200DC0F5|nr:bestrophin-1 [Leguminivora glycinivorella]